MKPHIFAMSCKIDSVCGELSTPAGRAIAASRFRENGISKIYLETYRNRKSAPAALLREIKTDLASGGFTVGASIVPTNMNERPAVTDWQSVSCFSDPAAQRNLRDVVKIAGEIFDFIIFDDFLFTTCTCPACRAECGGRDWGEYRCALMQQVINDCIIATAKAVNPACRIIIKYPCWYEEFYAKGYDLTADTALADEIWVGNETRFADLPQTRAYWIQRWANLLGKCGGGWYDPLSCPPEIFAEQARNTILGGAKESILHCYDYLFPTAKTFAQDGGGLQVPSDTACIAAFRRELAGLRQLAELIDGATPYGVKTLKKVNADQRADAEIHAWFNMLGIPVTAENELGVPSPVILSAHAVHFPDIERYVAALKARRIPFLITAAAAAAGLPGGSFAAATIVDCRDRLELYHMPELDALRNFMLEPFGLRFHAPARVSLLLFRKGGRLFDVIQNFNAASVEVEIHSTGTSSLKMLLPTDSSGTFDGKNKITLKPHAMLVLERSAQ